jgi:hypothetical protein
MLMRGTTPHSSFCGKQSILDYIFRTEGYDTSTADGSLKSQETGYKPASISPI